MAPDPAKHDRREARQIFRSNIVSIAKDCGPTASLALIPTPPRYAAPATIDALKDQYSRPHGTIEQAMPRNYSLVFRGSRWLIRLLIRAMIGEMEALLLSYPPTLSVEKRRQPATDTALPSDDAETMINMALASSDPLGEIDRSLENIGWDRAQWARDAGVHRTTPYRWFKTGRTRSRRVLTFSLNKWLTRHTQSAMGRFVTVQQTATGCAITSP
jgi:hypothetical protein